MAFGVAPAIVVLVLALALALSCLHAVAERPFPTRTKKGTPYISTSHVYGKYYSKSSRDGSKLTNCNTYYVFKPSAVGDDYLPFVLQFHGGGFTGGSATSRVTAEIEAYLDNGIAYVSADYRLVATKYFYEDENDSKEREEELINLDAEGRLTLDGSIPPIPLSSYLVKVGRQEFNVKCSYDAVQALEHLLANAEMLSLDPHRMGLAGSSAGGGEINYLAYVYHAWNALRYTPRSLAYSMAQIDYPVQNMLDVTWSLWRDNLLDGEGTLLSSVLAFEDCYMVVGNPWCASSQQPNPPPAETQLCNATWNEETMARYCDSREAFDSATLGDVARTQRWELSSPFDVGMEVLWYTSRNMEKHTPSSNFSLYVANHLNSTAGMNVVHAALYARLYGEVAERVGIDYYVLYTDFAGMRDADRSERRVGGETVFNVLSSKALASFPPVGSEVQPDSTEERVLFHCRALGIKDCRVSPSPSPSPSGNLSSECKAEIKAVCGGAGAGACPSCVRTNARDLMAHGCPRGQGAVAKVVAFCEALSL